MAPAIALFQFPDAQVAQMLAQRVAYQRRAVAFGAPRRAICVRKQLFVEHNLNRFHMWSPIHSVLHSTRGRNPGRTTLAAPYPSKRPV